MNRLFRRAVIVVLLGFCVVKPNAQQNGAMYEFTTAFGAMPFGCKDELSKPELYAVLTRVDPKLEAEINRTERRVQGAVGKNSMSSVITRLEYLQERFETSTEDPLSEDEIQELADLREAKSAHDKAEESRVRKQRKAFRDARERGEDPEPVERATDFPENDTLLYLASRVPLTRAESRSLQRGQELVATWRGLTQKHRVTVKPSDYQVHPLKVYQEDELRITIWEDDFFRDDRCFSTVVTLDRASLDMGIFQIRGGESEGPVLMILTFKPVH